MEDNRYIIITPYFPSEKHHMGSYVYDHGKTNVKIYDIQGKLVLENKISSNL